MRDSLTHVDETIANLNKFGGIRISPLNWKSRQTDTEKIVMTDMVFVVIAG